jgi:hypothetical protein
LLQEMYDARPIGCDPPGGWVSLAAL